MDNLEGQKTYAVIDGNSLMHRAFHAIPPTMLAPDGTPTNAIFGFFSMLLKLADDFALDGIIVAFDKGAPQVRMEMLPQYKAQRPPRDPLLSEQFPVAHKLLDALQIPICEVEGWEGDDILGTLARMGVEQGHHILLITGDRDSYQLVTDQVQVVATKKGITDVVVYYPQDVVELYEGVRPELIPDFYGLKGDTSDNIPGVPGIGPKKAAQLIVEYGNLDNVLAHAQEIKGKMGENIRKHTQDALISREVARIRTDAPVEFDAQKAAWPQFDAQEAKKVFDEYALVSLKHRILSLVKDGNGSQSSHEVKQYPNFDEHVLEGSEALSSLKEAIKQKSLLGIHSDTGEQTLLFGSGLDVWIATSGGWDVSAYKEPDFNHIPLVEVNASGLKSLVSASYETQNSANGKSIPKGYPSQEPAKVLHFENEEALQALTLAYKSGYVSSFSVKDDLKKLVPTDSSEPCLLDIASLDTTHLFDCSVAAYLLNSDRSDYSVSSLVSDYLPWSLPQEDAKEYSKQAFGMLAAVSACGLQQTMTPMLEADGALMCYRELEVPLISVLVELERAGMNLDLAELKKQSQALGQQIQEIQSRIWTAAGETFNIDSPMQLSHILFDVLSLPTKDPETGKPLKKTKTGFYSTNAKMLEGYAKSSAVVADVLDYRERMKIKSTYLDALPGQLEPGDKRVHTTYNQTVTATGRLSSSNPNLQNIPVRSELGRMVRTAFIPGDPSNVILSCDYSQIELRLLAHLSQDPGLIDAFINGEDFHRETAARVFGIDPKDVTPAQRSRAKAVNFGIVYGQTSYGLSQTLKITQYEAQDIIDRYYHTYPRVRDYLDEQVSFAREHGWVSTMFGRKRHVPEIQARIPNLRQFAERTAMNHPMQGSAADIIKLAMIAVQERLRKDSFKAQMILQVHDELDFDCPKTEVQELSSIVTEIMQNVVKLRVPLLVSCATGPTWAEAK
ncbi:MAG: DNA polymerase I [Coriobacteriales bacterium]|nr:DNA polymerase I [Coriobacteriales bacterium]